MIAISFPRYSKKAAKALRYASSRGMTAIAITDSPQSPLAAGASHLENRSLAGGLHQLDRVKNQLEVVGQKGGQGQGTASPQHKDLPGALQEEGNS